MSLPPLEVGNHQSGPVRWSLAIAPWKMNLLAISSEGLVFIAEGRKVSVARLAVDSTISAPFKSLGPSSQPINAIRIGTLGSEEVLGTVDDRGEVRVYYPRSLDRRPIVFSNSVSTWGLAFGGQSFLMAMSSNSHNVTLMDTKNHTYGNHATLMTLRGHAHNVPCVDFSPCGRYLVSASIDQTCTLWNTATGHAIKSAKISSEWGWGVRFVDETTFKYVPEGSKKDISKGQHILLKIRNEAGLSPFTFHTHSMEVLQRLVRREIGLEDATDDEEEEGEGEDLELENGYFPEEDYEMEGEELEIDVDDEEPLIPIEPQERRAARAPPRRVPEIAPLEHPCPHIIFTSQHHLFLLDSQLKPLAELRNPLALPVSAAHTDLYAVDRLSLLDYIPEYSLLILASQGTGKAMLIRIVRSTSAGKPVYHFVPETIVPGFNLSRSTALVGMDTRKNYVKGRLTSVDLVLLYQSGFHLTCEISQEADKPLDSVDSLLI